MIKVIHSVSVMNRAGQETLLMNILRNIDRTKIHFSFLCSLSVKGDYDEEINNLGGELFHLYDNKLQSIKYLNYLGDLYSYYHFFSRHKEFQIFHIHNYHSFTTFIQVLGAKLAKIPIVIVHSHNSNAPHAGLHYLFRRLLNLFKIYRFSCSEVAANWMFGKSKHNVILIKNGIMLQDFVFDSMKRSVVRNNLNLNNEQYVIGHIGRFNYQKNHEFLIEIFNEIHTKEKKAHLVLVGIGELEAEIKHKVEELHLSNFVSFLGVRTDIPALLSAFDLFLFPSLFEGLSVVLIEAQAAGLPCLISNANSPEVKLTEGVTMFSLEKSAKKWADKALDYKSYEKSKDCVYLLREQGYDIKTSSEYLLKLYTSFMQTSKMYDRNV